MASLTGLESTWMGPITGVPPTTSPPSPLPIKLMRGRSCRYSRF